MVLDKQAFIIHGGCNCRAIRYEVSVPAWLERPETVYKTSGSDVGEDARLPAVYLDHCNDCRRATSSVLPMALISELNRVTVALLPIDNNGELRTSGQMWTAANEVFISENNSHLAVTYLTLYRSSPNRNRWFCRRCGTMLAYSIDSEVIPKDWPQMLDIWLGRVDRKDLEKECMAPERMLWCEKAIPWIFNLARKGSSGIPEHPLTKIDHLVKA